MNTSLEHETVHPKGLGQTRMSRCLFGDWPRRMVLKLTLPVTDLPLSLPSCKERMSTDIKAC
ncbi:hypothetical protein [Candidatus Nitrospira allomarina]|uniref:Uncharacterized protein n=1 Tax=Candidatus Nitrospira allomarina TaxID=3020900 RepID=A0AA96G880_9BACT|nr:hypothetical protein [Candidatus Nitrospira allomarina]WNM56676.1 hypothetical protein PP769_11880 [Candidatus Nitrospira allomarina]